MVPSGSGTFAAKEKGMDILTKRKTKKIVKVSQEEQGQMLIHCHFKSEEESYIRIWPSTFVICRDTGKRNKLLHAENISIYPNWTKVLGKHKHSFTLIFARLPKKTVVFHLLEDIPEEGGFNKMNLKRNNNDVYEVWL